MTFHDENYPEDVPDDEAYMLTERHAPATERRTPAWDISVCLDEFGPHEDHIDCAATIAMMSDPFGDFDPYADDIAAYSREAEENMLGRPLFPNEY